VGTNKFQWNPGDLVSVASGEIPEDELTSEEISSLSRQYAQEILSEYGKWLDANIKLPPKDHLLKKSLTKYWPETPAAPSLGGKGGPCKPGQTASETGCIPASGETSSKLTAKPDAPQADEKLQTFTQAELNEDVNSDVDEKFSKEPEWIEITAGQLHLQLEQPGRIGNFTHKQIKEAIGDYTAQGGIAESLNTQMRSCPPKFDCVTTYKATMEAIETVIDSLPPFPEPLRAYRGMNGVDVKTIVNNAMEAMKSGKEMMLPSLTSVASNYNAAMAFADDLNNTPGKLMYQIKAKKGLSVGAQSEAGIDESEIIMSAHARYKVVGVKKTNYKSWVMTTLPTIYLEQIA
jgi:hypothetical protein